MSKHLEARPVVGRSPSSTRFSGRFPGLFHGVLATLCVAAAPAFAPAALAQEPVVEPEPVIEDGAPEVEPVIESDRAESSSSSSSSAVVDPPSRVARLGYIDGDVTVAPAGTDDWADAVLNRPLTSGDRVWVEKGRAELQIGSSALYIDHDTGFGVIELDDDVLQASLTEGAVTLRVRRLAEGETIQVETPHATIYINRVGEYHLEVDKDGDRTIVKTRSGEAEVTGGKQSYVVRANERGVFSGLEKLSGDIQPLGPRTAFENWANDRDARNQKSQSAKYVSRDVIGYEDLDQNGEWFNDPEYGYVWRPINVVVGWAPYRYGRWVYVSPWGWSWIDDAPWGFAPFHYGRWVSIRDRWCWVPGPRDLRPVYAPALVGWIGGPSVSVSITFGSGIGWYPLGPADVFYPGYRYTPRYIRYVNVHNTIVINNSYFYGGRRAAPPPFDYRRYPHAVTIVDRANFVGGRPITNHWGRVNDNDLRNWRGAARGPAITPQRESVLAGATRRAPASADRFNQWRSNGGTFAGRVPFNTERSSIEANGGRPPSRTELRTANRNPKEGGDFRSTRSTTSSARPGASSADVKRTDRATNGASTNRSRESQNQPRVLDNNSVRESQARRDAERSGSSQSRPSTPSRSSESSRGNSRETESRESQSSSESRTPANNFRSENDSNASIRQETREPTRGSSPSIRSESRESTQSRESVQSRETRREAAPVQQRSEPRTTQSESRQSEPRQNAERAQPSQQQQQQQRSNEGSKKDSRERPGNSPEKDKE